jgi:hypothetical protein
VRILDGECLGQVHGWRAVWSGGGNKYLQVDILFHPGQKVQGRFA